MEHTGIFAGLYAENCMGTDVWTTDLDLDDLRALGSIFWARFEASPPHKRGTYSHGASEIRQLMGFLGDGNHHYFVYKHKTCTFEGRATPPAGRFLQPLEFVEFVRNLEIKDREDITFYGPEKTPLSIRMLRESYSYWVDHFHKGEDTELALEHLVFNFFGKGHMPTSLKELVRENAKIIEEKKQVTFTNDRGREVTQRLGRYLRRHYPKIGDEDLRDAVDDLTFEYELRVTQDMEHILEIIETGPSSCMTHVETCDHPYRVYSARLGWSLAYAEDNDGDVVARALVMERDDRKYFVTTYGEVDSRGFTQRHGQFESLLKRHGYEARGSFLGEQIEMVPLYENNSYLMPYIDGGCGKVIIHEGTFKIEEENGVSAGATSGVLYIGECDHCEALMEDDPSEYIEAISQGEYEEIIICQTCRDEEFVSVECAWDFSDHHAYHISDVVEVVGKYATYFMTRSYVENTVYGEIVPLDHHDNLCEKMYIETDLGSYVGGVGVVESGAEEDIRGVVPLAESAKTPDNLVDAGMDGHMYYALAEQCVYSVKAQGYLFVGEDREDDSLTLEMCYLAVPYKGTKRAFLTDVVEVHGDNFHSFSGIAKLRESREQHEQEQEQLLEVAVLYEAKAAYHKQKHHTV